MLVSATCVNAQVGSSIQKNTTFKSNSVSINEKSNIFTYSGNVSFNDNVMEVKNANKIVYNAKSKELIITGAENFTFDGEIEVSEVVKVTTIRYKMGERVAYVE